MLYIEQALLCAENNALVQTIQRYLNLEELETLNIILYEFTDQCTASRPQPHLNQAIYAVKMDFRRMDTPIKRK